MSPRWEELSSAPPPPAAGYVMDAVLSPHRALGRQGVRLVLLTVALANLALGAFFALRGAYPVAAFLALDMLLLWLAFAANKQSGRVREFVRVAPDRVHVVRAPARGKAAHYVVHPSWARVSAEPQAVRIAAGDRIMDVGAFLSPQEREEFAHALARALERARAQRPNTSAME